MTDCGIRGAQKVFVFLFASPQSLVSAWRWFRGSSPGLFIDLYYTHPSRYYLTLFREISVDFLRVGKNEAEIFFALFQIVGKFFFFTGPWSVMTVS